MLNGNNNSGANPQEDWLPSLASPGKRRRKLNAPSIYYQVDRFSQSVPDFQFNLQQSTSGSSRDDDDDDSLNFSVVDWSGEQATRNNNVVVVKDDFDMGMSSPKHAGHWHRYPVLSKNPKNNMLDLAAIQKSLKPDPKANSASSSPIVDMPKLSAHQLSPKRTMMFSSDGNTVATPSGGVLRWDGSVWRRDARQQQPNVPLPFLSPNKRPDPPPEQRKSPVRKDEAKAAKDHRRASCKSSAPKSRQRSGSLGKNKAKQTLLDNANELKDWGFCSNMCQHCGKTNSDVDGMLIQCAKCKKATFCSMKCFSANMATHSKYCGQAGSADGYREFETKTKLDDLKEVNWKKREEDARKKAAEEAEASARKPKTPSRNSSIESCGSSSGGPVNGSLTLRQSSRMKSSRIATVAPRDAPDVLTPPVRKSSVGSSLDSSSSSLTQGGYSDNSAAVKSSVTSKSNIAAKAAPASAGSAKAPINGSLQMLQSKRNRNRSNSIESLTADERSVSTAPVVAAGGGGEKRVVRVRKGTAAMLSNSSSHSTGRSVEDVGDGKIRVKTKKGKGPSLEQALEKGDRGGKDADGAGTVMSTMTGTIRYKVRTKSSSNLGGSTKPRKARSMSRNRRKDGDEEEQPNDSLDEDRASRHDKSSSARRPRSQSRARLSKLLAEDTAGGSARSSSSKSPCRSVAAGSSRHSSRSSLVSTSSKQRRSKSPQTDSKSARRARSKTRRSSNESLRKNSGHGDEAECENHETEEDDEEVEVLEFDEGPPSKSMSRSGSESSSSSIHHHLREHSKSRARSKTRSGSISSSKRSDSVSRSRSGSITRLGSISSASKPRSSSRSRIRSSSRSRRRSTSRCRSTSKPSTRRSSNGEDDDYGSNAEDEQDRKERSETKTSPKRHPSLSPKQTSVSKLSEKFNRHSSHNAGSNSTRSFSTRSSRSASVHLSSGSGADEAPWRSGGSGKNWNHPARVRSTSAGSGPGVDESKTATPPGSPRVYSMDTESPLRYSMNNSSKRNGSPRRHRNDDDIGSPRRHSMDSSSGHKRSTPVSLGATLADGNRKWRQSQHNRTSALFSPAGSTKQSVSDISTVGQSVSSGDTQKMGNRSSDVSTVAPSIASGETVKAANTSTIKEKDSDANSRLDSSHRRASASGGATNRSRSKSRSRSSDIAAGMAPARSKSRTRNRSSGEDVSVDDASKKDSSIRKKSVSKRPAAEGLEQLVFSRRMDESALEATSGSGKMQRRHSGDSVSSGSQGSRQQSQRHNRVSRRPSLDSLLSAITEHTEVSSRTGSLSVAKQSLAASALAMPSNRDLRDDQEDEEDEEPDMLDQAVRTVASQFSQSGGNTAGTGRGVEKRTSFFARIKSRYSSSDKGVNDFDDKKRSWRAERTSVATTAATEPEKPAVDSGSQEPEKGVARHVSWEKSEPERKPSVHPKSSRIMSMVQRFEETSIDNKSSHSRRSISEQSIESGSPRAKRKSLVGKRASLNSQTTTTTQTSSTSGTESNTADSAIENFSSFGTAPRVPKRTKSFKHAFNKVKSALKSKSSRKKDDCVSIGSGGDSDNEISTSSRVEDDEDASLTRAPGYEDDYNGPSDRLQPVAVGTPTSLTRGAVNLHPVTESELYDEEYQCTQFHIPATRTGSATFTVPGEIQCDEMRTLSPVSNQLTRVSGKSEVVNQAIQTAGITPEQLEILKKAGLVITENM